MSPPGGNSEPDTLFRYRSDLEQFAEVLLRSYLDKLKVALDSDALSTYKASKELNDPVWGTVQLTPVELVVVDSPLLQRLRRIRQLGVVHLVYPGAHHSRFEHSIGVCHQVGRIARSMNDHAISAGSDAPFDPKLVQKLRLAGLVHDVGHGLLSHVSENALQTRVVERLTVEFKRHHRKREQPQLSEMAAYYILRSPAFKELIKLAFSLAEAPPDSTAAEDIATMVAGLRLSDEYPLLHQLISGPFDADKLDYMARDAAMCGVPAVTDVDRLVQKMRAVRVPADALPQHLKDDVKKVNSYTVTGVARSGARAIDEVVLGRTLMFDKIYRHHKVRAAEAMVASILSAIAAASPDSAPLLPLKWTDDNFSSLSAEELLPLLPREDGDGAASAPEVLRRLRDRDLFVRAYAFAQRRGRDGVLSQDERLEGRSLADDLATPEGRREFVELLADEVTTIATYVDLPLRKNLPGDSLVPYIWADPPATVKDASNETRAYLVEDDDSIREVKNVIPDLRAWADAYVNTRDVGYIFAPREIAEAVAVAADVVMLRAYGVRPTASLNAYVKVEAGGGRRLRAELLTAGYFEHAPRELRPEPEILARAGFADRLNRLAALFAGYQGPSRRVNESEPGGAVTADRIRNWVRQFPDELIDIAMTTVEAVRVIDRDTANLALQGFLESHSEFSSSAVTPLGDPKDGASVLAYYIGDIAGEAGIPVVTREEALLREGPVIFVDDVVGLGNASVEFFEGILGSETTTSLSQSARTKLSETAAAALRKKPIAIVYCAALPGGKEAVEKRLGELGLQATIYVANGVDWIPTLDRNVRPKHPDVFDEFLDECRRVGTQLLKDKDWDAATLNDCVLGYGNSGVLLASTFNTPTMTLTALWRRSPVDGVPWEPLLPRRDKR